MLFYFVTVLVALIVLFYSLKILNEYERGVVFRLGRIVAPRGPGLVVLIPGIERMRRMDMRVVTMDVPPQDVITRDNVSVKVNAVIYFRVDEPNKAVIEVEQFLYAVSQLAQTTLRGVCGVVELDELLVNRASLNTRIFDILDNATDPWGIKVSMVEIKQIDLLGHMQRTLAKQAEAERERRATVIAADGELQAAQKLVEAATIMAKHPQALQLRYLQTLTEISKENNSTVVFPVPTELLGFLQKYRS